MSEDTAIIKEDEGQEVVVEENTPAQQEMPLETSTSEVVVEKEDPKDSADELDTYSKNVQTRIKKLTEKYRQEERDKAEAVRVSQELLQENQKLKTRVNALDSGYLNEYGTRLQSQAEMAKRAYKEAHEAGDSDALVEAQQLMSTVAVEQQRYATAKARADQQARMPVQQQQQPVQQQQQHVQQQAQPDPKAQGWAQKNTWFGDDKIMTTAVFTIHNSLVDEEGFDPETDEYYSEIDRRMRTEFPHKFNVKKSGGGSQVASAGSSASRSTKQGRRTVKLSPSQIAIAKKLNVPLEEYAKYVKD